MLVQGQVLARLGINDRHISLINAWVHCDQFMASSETFHLYALRDALRSQSGGPSNAADRSLTDHASSCALSKKLNVWSSIGSKLGDLALDAFATLTSEQVPVVLDIVRLCAASPEDTHELLHKSIGSSTERELSRAWGEDVESLRSSRVAVVDAEQLSSRFDAVKVRNTAARSLVRRHLRLQQPTKAIRIRS